MRGLLVALCRFVLRITFRRIEVTGEHHVPSGGPVLFVLNHPNGLLDPVFILCLTERRVSFLAKEPLFRTPIVSLFVKAFECLPVYRARDGGDPVKNAAMMQQAVALLRRGNALAIFPEGTTHSEPSLKPFRSGASRIALAASSSTLGGEPVRVVPCGLLYTDKTRFRSKALVSFGKPLECERVELDSRFEPPQQAVKELTARLRDALDELTVQAGSVETLRLAEKAEQVLFSAAQDDAHLRREAPSRPSLQQRRALRQTLVRGYERLAVTHAAELHAVLGRLEAFEDFMASHDLHLEQRVLVPASRWLGYFLGALAVLLTLLPLALFGLVLNAPVYHLVAWLSARYAQGDEVVIGTAKVLGGMLLYPLSWLLTCAVVSLTVSVTAGAVVVLLSPLLAYAALLFLERANHAVTRGLVLTRLWAQPGLRRRIVDARRECRDAIVELERALPAPVDASH